MEDTHRYKMTMFHLQDTYCAYIEGTTEITALEWVFEYSNKILKFPKKNSYVFWYSNFLEFVIRNIRIF